MSEIKPLNSNNLSDLLKIAENLDITTDPILDDLYSNNSESSTTSYLRPKNIRTVFDSHKSDGNIKWTAADSTITPGGREPEPLFIPDVSGGEPRDLGNIIDVRGVIVNYQQRDELKYYDGEKSHIKCSVIGYRNSDDNIKALPNHPYGMKYTFEKEPETNKWYVNKTKPNNVVNKLGLIGNRGEKPTLCSECIKSGMSTETIPGIGDNGTDKQISCETRGRLYLAVYEVSIIKKVKLNNEVKGKAGFENKVITMPVSQLLDIEGENVGEFFLLEIPLSKTSIQGKYIKNSTGGKDEEASIMGYESFVQDLLNKSKNPKDVLRMPQFHYVKVKFRENPKSPIYQIDIRSLGPVTPQQFKESIEQWNIETPDKTIESLNISSIQEVTHPSPVTDTTPKKIVQVSVVEEDDDDDEMPF